MLKNNSKKARENIRNYIADHFDCTPYGIEIPEKFSDICHIIYDEFYKEKVKNDKRRMSLQAYFEEWCSGLPSILDTHYYWERSAVDDLGEILEESEIEKSRYSESDAEKMLTYLIYREIMKGVNE